MSSAVPTIMTRIMIAIIRSFGSSRSGVSSATTCPGMFATVISQALTAAVATRNITTALVRAAAMKTLYT